MARGGNPRGLKTGRAPTIRCFVALQPDEAARDRLDQLAREQQTRFPAARCMRRENVHLTLAFIGALDGGGSPAGEASEGSDAGDRRRTLGWDTLGVWLSDWTWNSRIGKERWQSGVAMDICRGHLLAQIWSDPDWLSPPERREMADLIAILKRGAGRLRNCRFIYGNPWKHEPYGYACSDGQSAFVANNNGVWNETPARIQITVVPPFWQTAWFQVLMGFVVIAVVAGGIRLRTKAIQDRNRQLERLVRERTSALEKRNQEIQALYQADERILRNASLHQVFQTLVDVAVDTLNVDRSVVFIWDETRTKVVPFISRGFAPETLKILEYAKGEDIVGKVLESGEPVVVRQIELNDFRSDIRRILA